MSRTTDEALDLIYQVLPAGMVRWMGLWDKDGDLYKFFSIIADMLRTYCFDFVDTLKAEIFPATTSQKIADFEDALALTTTPTAVYGTLAQRRAQVVGKLRESGAFTVTNTQSIVSPLLGYTNAANLVVIETDRSALRLLHSYPFGASDVTLPASTTTRVSFDVAFDGGAVSGAGAHLIMVFDDSDLTPYSFTLTSPDGTEQTWNRGWDVAPLVLRSKAFAGTQIQGIWTLDITNGTGTPNKIYASGTSLFVEGIAPNQSTGGAIFDWGVYADPAHLGENGTAQDFRGARQSIQRIKHAFTVGNLIQSIDPYPDTDSGVHASIPDEFIPV